MSMGLSFALVFVGGGLGSLLRYLVGLLALKWFGSAFPIGTLVVNCVGCLAMGLLARLIASPDAGGQSFRLFLMTGLLGGFTTYSAFALDAAHLFEQERAAAGLLYVAATLVSALGGVALGLAIGQALDR